MTSIEEIRDERAKKAQELSAKGIAPFPVESNLTLTNKAFLADFADLDKDRKVVTIGGRIMSMRKQGKAGFIDVVDGTLSPTENNPQAKVQIFVSAESLGAGDVVKGESLHEELFSAVDSSDFIEFTGTAYITKRGHNSLEATSWRLLSKSLRPVPDAWFGLKDEDERYRKRYLDLILNPELREMIKRRSIFWNTIRNYLLERDFIEVETPVIENTTGGADARPFITHHNALDIDVYLRISAGELWQKRLLVAGLPKVFEIGRIFRNEGMSAEHLQDYTQMEFYEAYSDYEKGMVMIKDLYKTIAHKTYGKTKFEMKEHTFDLNDDWAIYDFCKILKESYNVDPLHTTVAEVEASLKNAEIEYDKATISVERGVDLLWKKTRKTLAGPGFLVGIPVYLEPLAKKSRTNPEVVERFQIILAGSEVGKGFSELNDPIDQKERFERQQALRDAGDDEAQMADMDYVEAMEYGMPPAFGFGISERLFSFLEGKPVREAQIFPLMRKKEDNQSENHSDTDSESNK